MEPELGPGHPHSGCPAACTVGVVQHFPPIIAGMSELNILLDDETIEAVQRAAARSGESVGAWAADVLRRESRAKWPAEVAAILGSWDDDFPDASTLRQGYGPDAKRESF